MKQLLELRLEELSEITLRLSLFSIGAGSVKIEILFKQNKETQKWTREEIRDHGGSLRYNTAKTSGIKSISLEEINNEIIKLINEGYTLIIKK